MGCGGSSVEWQDQRTRVENWKLNGHLRSVTPWVWCSWSLREKSETKVMSLLSESSPPTKGQRDLTAIRLITLLLRVYERQYHLLSARHHAAGWEQKREQWQASNKGELMREKDSALQEPTARWVGSGGERMGYCPETRSELGWNNLRDTVFSSPED